MRLVLVAVLCASAAASADPKPADCLAELAARHIAFQKAARPGIAIAVDIKGPLGGVSFVSDDQPLVIDCSLAVSLDEAGHYLHALGLDKATFSSAYSRRNVRGTNVPSKHSYGLAIDVHTFHSAELGTVRVDRDFERNLGDEMDCVGNPQSDTGRALEILKCQLVRSGLFHLVLTPDYDDDHQDHFHLEAIPWRERSALRSSMPAIH